MGSNKPNLCLRIGSLLMKGESLRKVLEELLPDIRNVMAKVIDLTCVAREYFPKFFQLSLLNDW